MASLRKSKRLKLNHSPHVGVATNPSARSTFHVDTSVDATTASPHDDAVISTATDVVDVGQYNSLSDGAVASASYTWANAAQLGAARVAPLDGHDGGGVASVSTVAAASLPGAVANPGVVSAHGASVALFPGGTLDASHQQHHVSRHASYQEHHASRKEKHTPASVSNKLDKHHSLASATKTLDNASNKHDHVSSKLDASNKHDDAPETLDASNKHDNAKSALRAVLVAAKEKATVAAQKRTFANAQEKAYFVVKETAYWVLTAKRKAKGQEAVALAKAVEVLTKKAEVLQQEAKEAKEQEKEVKAKKKAQKQAEKKAAKLAKMSPAQLAKEQEKEAKKAALDAAVEEVRARIKKEGDERAEKGLIGLHNLFANVPHAIKVLLAVSTRQVEDILGHYQHFSEEDATVIALKHLLDQLTLLANHIGCTVEAILGCSVQDFVKLSPEDLLLRVLEFNQGRKVTDNANTLRFHNLLTIQSTYHDIIKDLTTRVCGFLVKKDGTYIFPTHVDALLLVQDCIGSLIKKGLLPKDFERTWTTDGFYVIDKYGTDVFDLNAQKDLNNTTHYDPLYCKLPLGTTGRFVRLVKPSQDYRDGLVIYRVYLRDHNGEHQPRQLHRLLQIVAANQGTGLSHSPMLKDYFGEQTLEDAFEYTPKSDAVDKEDCPTAKWSDVDHLVGRMEVWMNGLFFTQPTSHRHNMCLGWVRKYAGDWLYGLCSKFYTGGN